MQKWSSGKWRRRKARGKVSPEGARPYGKGAAWLTSEFPPYLQPMEGQTCLISVSSYPAPQKAKIESSCTLTGHSVPVSV